ncbi:MAG: MotA/TolQ/ExbB proton channel family protein [Desulfotalea sp.]
MKYKTLIGIIFCTMLFVTGFFLHGNFSLYFNLSGLLIVFGGTATTALVSFRYAQLKKTFLTILNALRKPVTNKTEVINILIDLSIKSRVEGILSLQEQENETSVSFLRRALGCLVDGYKIEQIRDIMNTEMYFYKQSRDDSERILRTIADFFPAFGIIGSVVGLITMLGGLGDTSVILSAIPIALTSTLYGLIFSNFFVLPLAAQVRERTNQEMLLRKIIIEGVISINSEVNPLILKTKLESFLTQDERDDELVSYSKIRERFNI